MIITTKENLLKYKESCMEQARKEYEEKMQESSHCKKSDAFSTENTCYQLTGENPWADGLLPAFTAPCTLRESWAILRPHAKQITLCFSPTSDAVYWELFDLQNEDGETRHFCYDHSLLAEDCADIACGSTYLTTYWSKAKGEAEPTYEEVTLTSIPNGDAMYDGKGDIEFCCKCQSVKSPQKEEIIPVSTLLYL